MENKKESSSREIRFCKYPKCIEYGIKPWKFNLLEYFGFTSGCGNRGITDMSKYKVNLERHRIHIKGQSNHDVESNDENGTGSGTGAGYQR